MLLKQEAVSFSLGNWEGTKGVTKVDRTQTADAIERSNSTTNSSASSSRLTETFTSCACICSLAGVGWELVWHAHMQCLLSKRTGWSPGLLTSSPGDVGQGYLAS